MIIIENMVYPSKEQFMFVMHGMRNPMNSWDKMDSEGFHLGKNDLSLASNLSSAGTEHAKYRRQLPLMMDITAPLYWWKEFDTYKIGVTANSCSTMHKIHAKEFTMDDFSTEHLDSQGKQVMRYVIDFLNFKRLEYTESGKNKNDWYNMIQILPTSYNQKRSVSMNYENVYNIVRQRSGHKLDEWKTFIEALKIIPYYAEFIESSLKRNE